MFGFIPSFFVTAIGMIPIAIVIFLVHFARDGQDFSMGVGQIFLMLVLGGVYSSEVLYPLIVNGLKRMKSDGNDDSNN